MVSLIQLSSYLRNQRQVYFVVRENGQNSGDNEDDKTKPVQMSFKKIEVKAVDFPGRKRF